MVITEKLLRELDVCQPGIDLWLTKKEPDPISCIDQLIKIKRFYYATWLIAHLLTPKNAAKLAIYSAEQALPVFEARCPNDNRPRKAIQAAKRALKNHTKINIDAAQADEYAALAAKYAALAAKYAALAARADAAQAAEYAALAAEYSTLAAEYSTRAADYAAISADPVSANKIIRYGKTLLQKQMKEG